MDSDTLGMLKDYIRRGGPVFREGKLLVFAINRHRGWQIVKECSEKAGLPRLVNPKTGKVHNVSPHRLRDAFAVHAVKTEWRPLQPMRTLSYLPYFSFAYNMQEPRTNVMAFHRMTEGKPSKIP